METVVSRTRGQRNTGYSSRKRKKHNTDENSRITRIIKQLIICVAIFVIYLTMKNVNNLYTQVLTQKSSQALRMDTNLSSLISSAKSYLSSMNITNEKLKSVFSYQATDTSINQASKITADMQDKIFDATQLKDKGFVLPVGGVVTSGFGFRVNTVTKANEFHEGVDLNAKEGDDIKATLEGVVLEAKYSQSLGNYVKLKHSDDIISTYAHASSLLVQEGQIVAKGQVIAKAGSTGLADGPHLHFEIHKGDKIVNPENILNFNTKLVVEGG